MNPIKFAALTMILVGAKALPAETYELDSDQAPKSLYLDRWVYPFNVSPGARIQASTFGALGSEGFDDRDGQYLIAINTEGLGIPAGRAPASYEVDSARLTITEAVGGYRFDGTYDPFATYLDSSMPRATEDADAGRPIELYGAGLRNGFETFGWPDGAISTDAPVFSAGSSFGVAGRAARNVYAAAVGGADVSNNVDSLGSGENGFDPRPFSVGQAVDSNGIPVAEGSQVESGTRFEFSIDVADPGVNAYLREGLARGQLGFVVSSLHNAGLLGGGDPYANFATADHFAYAGPKFEIVVRQGDSGPAGDFNATGTLDISDLKLLSESISTGANDVKFDVTGEMHVDLADLEAWVIDLYGTYFGDANLDGEFSSRDLIEVFGAGEYEDNLPSNSTWATGDWNADAEFNTSDLVMAFQDGGFEQGRRSATWSAVVPEPASKATALLSWIWLLGRRRRAQVRTSVQTS